MHKQSLNGAWQFCQAGSDEWLPAVVPGGAHTDLLAAGRIPDPFEADNELSVQWVADADWTYRRTFQVSQELLANECVELVCDGLDTLAEVRLNGTLVGTAENAFRQYRWQVKECLHAGENELVVDFASPTRFCAAHNQERMLNMANDALPGAPYLRKAPCHFGWDWGPKLPAVGIWRDIRLEGSTYRPPGRCAHPPTSRKWQRRPGCTHPGCSLGISRIECQRLPDRPGWPGYLDQGAAGGWSGAGTSSRSRSLNCGGLMATVPSRSTR